MALVAGIAWRWPLLGNGFFRRVEEWIRQAGERKTASIIGTGLLVIVVRLSVIPLIGIPVPQVHDEFSYLLTGDTFAHGRLTNPPHPMSVYLESFHEIQSPTYMSKFPPAQGAVLAAGELLGHPWIGVLLSVAVMCGLITWALQGWLPSQWALLGGILAVTQFGATNYWISGYMGGAVAAIGGALMIGALPRILVHHRPVHAISFALGIGLLANSRPYEGAVFCLPMVAALGYCLIRQRRRGWSIALARVVIPISAALCLVGAFMAYDNWRVTGKPLLFPYSVYSQTYQNSPLFLWGSLAPPKHYRNPQFAAFYDQDREGWLLGHSLTWSGMKHAFLDKLDALQNFYAPPELAIPILISLLWWRRSFKVRFLVVVCAFLTAGVLVIAYANPHYAAACTAAVYVLIALGLKRLRPWTVKSRPIGLGLTRALVLFHVLLLPAQAGALGLIHKMGHVNSAWARERLKIQAKLESMPGQDLVLVRYPATFIPSQEWVFNAADIDQAKVVWAREIPGLDMNPLLEYFHGRQIWLVEPHADGSVLFGPYVSVPAKVETSTQ